MATESAASIAMEMLAIFMFPSFGWRAPRLVRGFSLELLFPMVLLL
jgi:hypothetical protein